MAYKVNVLMSAYNGAHYVVEQIESLMRKKNVDVSLYIRDDGSKDDTCACIRQKQFKNVYIEEGNNVGYRKSFMRLLLSVPTDHDYYAFCDQDDVWKEDKLERACSYLSKQEGPALYCAKPQYVNDQLQLIEGNGGMLDTLPLGEATLEDVIATGLFGLGCTMVWNKALQNIIVSYKGLAGEEIAHDNFMTVLAGAVGHVYLDGEKVFLYRQHATNASGDKQSKIVGTKIENLKGAKKATNFNYNLRMLVYTHYSKFIPENRRKLMKVSLDVKGHIVSRLRYLFVGFPHRLVRYQKIKFIVMTLTGNL